MNQSSTLSVKGEFTIFRAQEAHSQAVIEVFELLNVVAYFGDPLVIDARANDVAKEPATGGPAQ